MEIAPIDYRELIFVWQWIQAEPEYHIFDGSPETFEDFVKIINADERAMFGIRVGKKLVGAIGLVMDDKEHGTPEDPYLKISGIHFIPEVRHTGIPQTAFTAILGMLLPRPVYLEFPESNPFMRRFCDKCMGEEVDTDSFLMRNGEKILKARFKFNDRKLVTLN